MTLDINARRRLSTERLYKLSKIIVLAITTLALVFTIRSFYLLENDNLLRKWESYCAKNPDDSEFTRLTGHTCMGTGLEDVDLARKNLSEGLLITIALPSSFFGGVTLYKYLFPIRDKESDRN